MSEPIFLMIGGEKVELPPIMNFATLKRVWPAMLAMKSAADVVDQVTVAIRVVSGALVKTRPDLTPEEIESRLRIIPSDDERAGVLDAYLQLLRQSGLIQKGEAEPAQPARTDPSSTETSTGSSPS